MRNFARFSLFCECGWTPAGPLVLGPKSEGPNRTIFDVWCSDPVYAGIRKTRGIKQEGKAAVTLKLIQRMVDIVEGGPLTAPGPGLDPYRVHGRDAAVGTGLNPLRTPPAPPPGDHHHASQVEDRPEGQGREVEIARGSRPEHTPLCECTCPVRALEQWLRQAGIESGPVFPKRHHLPRAQADRSRSSGTSRSTATPW
jgi:hypothetical protein